MMSRDRNQRAAFFAGPGDARARCREMVWSATPLGPVQAWARSLRTAVRLCLEAKSPMAVWAGSEHTLIHNDAYAPVLGAKAAWAMGRPLREVWSEIWDLVAPQFHQVTERGESVRYDEVRYVLRRRGRDEEAYFAYGLTPIREDDGRIVGAFNVLEETTRTVKARDESEDRYRALFESILEGFCIVESLLDADGRGADYRFLVANPAFERHTGLRSPIGKTARELIPDLETRWPLAYGRIATTGVPERFVDHSAAMGRWFEVDAFRIGRPEERKVAILFRDITERMQAEQAQRDSRDRLERERKRLQLILDTLPVGLYILDADGGVVMSNDLAKRVWCGSAPLASVRDYDKYKGFWPQTGERLEPQQWPAAQALLFGRKIEAQVMDIERFDGTRGTLLFSAAPLRREDGAIDGAVVAIQDVSELRETQARLEEADRQKNQFLAVLSHELRNPLAPVKNSLYVLGRVPPGGDQARRALDVIERQVEQLTNLVNDLLDVTRITSGKVKLQLRRLELNELVRRTLEDHRGLFELSQVGARLELAPQPVLVDADWNRVSQITSNLLQNAAKFTPPDGSVAIAVSTDSSRGHALIRVTDTGVGLAPKMLQRLFEPFAQADDTLDRSKGGLGLGLALVKQLAELHGGSVEARSEGAGSGAEFVVRLPLAASPAAADAGERDRPAAAAPRRRVLVIEDNRDAADSLCALLELQGHEVALANDGPDGLAKAREFRPDVVLCDIGLPGMDGYQVARAVRAEEALTGTYLVALSGYARPEDLERAAAAGFDKHLAKPASAEALESVLAAGK